MKFTESGKIVLEGSHQRSLEKAAKPLTVLVAEDDPFVRDLIDQVLTQVGHTALVAQCGEKALRLADAAEVPLDLLLTDVVMPRMNGLDLALALRERFPRLPVLFISGYTHDLLPFEAADSVNGAFLQKPFRPPLLLERMQQAIEFAGK